MTSHWSNMDDDINQDSSEVFYFGHKTSVSYIEK